MPEPDPMFVSLLGATVNSGASDLHVAGKGGDRAPRRRSRVVRDCATAHGEEVDRIAYSLLDERKLEDLRRDRQVDYSFGVNGLGRFCADAFRQSGNPLLALRAVPYSVRSPEELGAPAGSSHLG